jgi:hypothetical protein
MAGFQSNCLSPRRLVLALFSKQVLSTSLFILSEFHKIVSSLLSKRMIEMTAFAF